MLTKTKHFKRKLAFRSVLHVSCNPLKVCSDQNATYILAITATIGKSLQGFKVLGGTVCKLSLLIAFWTAFFALPPHAKCSLEILWSGELTLPDICERNEKAGRQAGGQGRQEGRRAGRQEREGKKKGRREEEGKKGREGRGGIILVLNGQWDVSSSKSPWKHIYQLLATESNTWVTAFPCCFRFDHFTISKKPLVWITSGAHLELLFTRCMYYYLGLLHSNRDI